MNQNRTYTHHYKESLIVPASSKYVFEYIDDHSQFSSHMNNSSWMMAGSKMDTEIDDMHGQQVGSHIKMTGSICGINMFLDEVVIKREPPSIKVWETVGMIKIIIIDHYRMSVSIKPHQNTRSELTLSIDYNLPVKNTWLGFFFGKMYAKWCVNQMLAGVKHHFKTRL